MLRPMRTKLVCAITWLFACSGAPQTTSSPSGQPTAPPPPPGAATCSQQVTGLGEFVERLHLGDQTIPAPWPTGDATRDHHIDELLTAFRAEIKPEDKGSHFLPQQLRKITPGKLERLYEHCPASLASL